jgi:hypothetical protein
MRERILQTLPRRPWLVSTDAHDEADGDVHASRLRERAVSISTGVCRAVRSAESTAKPSTPGSITSSTIRSWSPFSAACRPSAPFSTTSTV